MIRVVGILVLLVALAGGSWLWERWNFDAPGPSSGNQAAETVVVIRQGDGLWTIANQLRNAGVVQSAALFALGVRLRRETPLLKAGEYAIPSPVSMDDLAAHGGLCRRGCSCCCTHDCPLIRIFWPSCKSAGLAVITFSPPTNASTR